MDTRPNHVPWRYLLALIASALAIFLLVISRTAAHSSAGTDQAISAPAVTTTVTPTATPCYGPNPIQNPGFETGSLSPWVILGANPTPVVINTDHHSGFYSVKLGTLFGIEPTGDSSIYQQFTVPPEGGTLSYWWNGFATDGECCDIDYQDAYITDTSGHILAVIMHRWMTTGVWINQTFDMAPYAGQTVRVEFLVYEDGFGDDTAMYVDDVAILTPEACHTVTPSATPCYGPEPVQNPGFETGSLPPWVILDSAATPTVTTAQAHTGNYSALLGTVSGSEPYGDSSIYQQVVIPPAGGTLSFWYYPGSNDHIDYDWQDVYITDVSGDILATVMHRRDNTYTWTNVTYNMSAFAYQMVRVEFLVHQDGSGDPTFMYVDDVHVFNPGICDTPSPAPTLTPALSPTTVPPTATPGIPPSSTPTSTIPPSSTATSTRTPTATPTATPCYGPNLIRNPGFETGSLTPWVIRDSAATPTVTNTNHYSGNYSAFLGILSGWEPTGDSSIYQQVTVPPGGGTLSFWFYPENCDSAHEEYDAAYVTDLNGNVLATVMFTQYLGGFWAHWTYDMAAFAGQTVRVEFLVYLSGIGCNPHMYVDDVALLTPGACPTSTPGGPPSSTPTSTVPPSATPSSTRTPAAMPTSTIPPASPTSMPLTGTTTPEPASPTRTSVPPTATSPGASPTGTAVVSTPVPSPTSCSLQFADVLPGSTFYPYVRCLACLDIVSGYPCGGPGEPCDGRDDPYFRPGNLVTRGQLAKIVSNSAGFGEPVSGQTFEDVPPGSPFYLYVERLASRGVMSGYPCDGQGEPCGPQRKPYFRPGSSASRGQLTKIVSNAAGFVNPIPAGQQTFADVPAGSPFYLYVERLLMNRPGVMSGYPCGGPGEPCDPEQRPYFRPGNDLTRGQTTKVVSNTFFPDCQVGVGR